MTFDEVIGQRETADRLRHMADSGQLPHALMLCGPSGSGKMALAMNFAAYLLKADTDENARAMLQRWEHPDLHFSFPVIRPPKTPKEHKMVSDDFRTEWHTMLLQQGCYFSMDLWLEYMRAENQQAVIFVGESDALEHKLSLKSSQGGYKVCIIWLPERMREECANKMLKLLEEPPSQTVFLMVCEKPELLLQTIRSRVQRIDVKKIDTDDMQQALVTERGLSDDVALRIARVADGSWLRASALLEADNETHVFFSLFATLMRYAWKIEFKELKQWSETVSTFGREKQKRLLTYLQRMVRECFVYNFHDEQLNYMTEEEEQFAVRFAPFINEANIVEMNELLERCQLDISRNVLGKIVFFDMALQIVTLLKRK